MKFDFKELIRDTLEEGIHTLSGECYCGYSTEEMPFGTSSSIAETKFYYPILCKTCGELFCTNIKDLPPLCLKCYSSNISLYGTPEMKGELIEIDVNSDDFKEYYNIANTFHELECEDNGEPYYPLEIESCKKEYVKERIQYRKEAPSPIFTHYNYCPGCTENRLEFFYLSTGWIVSELP
jgi:hypothetical protein